MTMQSFRQFLQREALTTPVAWHWDTKAPFYQPTTAWRTAVYDRGTRYASDVDPDDPDAHSTFDAQATFTVDGLTYHVEFGFIQTPKTTQWIVSFELLDIRALRAKQSALGFAPAQMAQSGYDTTGTGHEYTVMSTVVDIIKAFMRIVHPEQLSFSGTNVDTGGKVAPRHSWADPSSKPARPVTGRVRLYTRLVRQAATLFPDYTYKVTPGRYSTNFFLIRKSSPRVQTEALKSPVSWRWVFPPQPPPPPSKTFRSPLAQMRIARFTVESIEYVVDFNYQRITSEKQKKRCWSVIFEYADPDMVVRQHREKGRKIDPSGVGGTDLGGTGHEFTVMSTIVAIVKEFLQREQPDQLVYVALIRPEEGPGRVNLYTRLTRMAPKAFPDYRTRTTRNNIAAKFYLIRKTPATK